jgi:hypothetical protein
MSFQTNRVKVAIFNCARIAVVLLASFWLWSVAGNAFSPNFREMADRVSRGESYDPSILRKIVSTQPAERYCDPERQRNLLLLQFRLAADADQLSNTQSDSDVGFLSERAKNLLSCSPTESLAWLALYWAEIHTAGFGPKALLYLQQSYVFAPHEEWIQFIRSPLVLRSPTVFPDFIQQDAVIDFDDIFHSQLYPSAALVYKMAAEKIRPVLLDRICHYPLDQRRIFVHFVSAQGLSIKHACFETNDGSPYGSG